MIEIMSINDGLEAGTATVITEEVGSAMRIERAMEIAQHATSSSAARLRQRDSATYVKIIASTVKIVQASRRSRATALI